MGLGFALTLIFAKNLEPLEFSTLSLFLIYSALAAQMLEMGAGNAFLREYNLKTTTFGKKRIIKKYIIISINKLIFLPILVAITSLSIDQLDNIHLSNLMFWALLIFSNYIVITVNSYYQATSQYTALTYTLVKNVVLRCLAIYSFLTFERTVRIDIIVTLYITISIVGIINWEAFVRNQIKFDIGMDLRKIPDFVISKSKYNSDISRFNLLSLFLNRLDYIALKNFVNLEVVGTYYILQQLISPIGIVYNSINIRRSPDFFKKVGGFKSYFYNSIYIFALLTTGMIIVFYIIQSYFSDNVPDKYNYLVESVKYAIFFANAAGLLSMINILHNKTGNLAIMNIQIILISLISVILLLLTNGIINNYFIAMALLNLFMSAINYVKFIKL
jgi:hypothetical protein